MWPGRSSGSSSQGITGEPSRINDECDLSSPVGRHQLRPALRDHVELGNPSPWRGEEAARGAFRAGYDGMGRVSVEHFVERGCSAMLTRAEAVAT